MGKYDPNLEYLTDCLCLSRGGPRPGCVNCAGSGKMRMSRVRIEPKEETYTEYVIRTKKEKTQKQFSKNKVY
jgi:hypothetical protein